MYSVKILKDSVSPAGSRLTTFELTYPRFIHAELMTHRLFSRNSASSRAIPISRFMELVRLEPAMPTFWGKNKAGMQADEELSVGEIQTAKVLWLYGRDQALSLAKSLESLGLHKQIVNRVLEPFSHITVIVSATNFSNFFKLRNHADAQPEIRSLAAEMKNKYEASTPEQLHSGDWHMPMLQDRAQLEAEGYSLEDMKLIAAGRVARVSYLTHEGKREPEKDLQLARRLSSSDPPHMSPFEHIAMALTEEQWNELVSEAMRKRKLFDPAELGNFVGWLQLRKTFKNEAVLDS